MKSNKEIKDLVDSMLSGKTEEEKKSRKTTKTILGAIASFYILSSLVKNFIKADEHYFPKSSFKYDFLHTYRWPFVFGFSALFLLYGLPLIEDFIIENNIINVKPDPSEWMQWDYQDRLENPTLPIWLELVICYIFYEILYFISFRKILLLKSTKPYVVKKDIDEDKSKSIYKNRYMSNKDVAKWQNERKKKK